MKKLMIAMAVAVAAASLNAASVSWFVEGVTAANEGDTLGSYWAYCFLTSDSSSLNTTYDATTLVNSIKNGSDPYDDGLDAGAYVSASGTLTYTADVTITGASESSPVNMHAYAIIIDSDTVATDGSTAYQAVDCGEVSFVKDAVLSAVGTASASSWSNAAATPEPTSGLLLVLGAAGLALRRKRA